MCDAIKMLKDMKDYQVKVPDVVCTSSAQCWCNDISYRISMEQMNHECMSPQELLDAYGEDMNKKDKIYLLSLAQRVFKYG